MSEQIVRKTSGDGDVVKTTRGGIKGAPAAHTSSDIPSLTHIKWSKDPRPKTGDDTPRSLEPYWDISIYTETEINAIRKADKLEPDLAEYYKDLLED